LKDEHVEREGLEMTKFRGRPLEVQAEQYKLLEFAGHHSDQHEAERLRAALEIDDPKRIVAGALPGWIEFFNPAPNEGGVLRPGMWLVAWPDGHLTALEPAQFDRLFIAEQRRQSSRKRVSELACIVFHEGERSIRTHILDVSDAGAMLMPNDIFMCPSEFVLKPDNGVAHHCEVKWRRGANMGVRFLN
jgi:hypothetical protein